MSFTDDDDSGHREASLFMAEADRIRGLLGPIDLSTPLVPGGLVVLAAQLIGQHVHSGVQTKPELAETGASMLNLFHELMEMTYTISVSGAEQEYKEFIKERAPQVN